MSFGFGQSMYNIMQLLVMVTCIGEPLLKQRFELAHVLKAEIERLKSRDGGLTEIIAVKLPHGQSHITL